VVEVEEYNTINTILLTIILDKNNTSTNFTASVVLIISLLDMFVERINVQKVSGHYYL
jgi:hypothetical protein